MTRYIGSLAGLLHASCSVAALLLGNYMFLQCFLLGNDILASSETDDSSFLPVVFHITTALSGFIVLVFFPHKIQSYQHSTTSIKDKGLTAKQMQDVNKSRGCYSLIICAVYPLMYRYLPDDRLQDIALCRIVAGWMIVMTLHMHGIFKPYGKGLFILYAGTKFGFSLHVLFSGSLYAVRESYPGVVNFLEKEALLISSCVEFGFLLYYCESRKIVSVQFLRNACKRYHPMMIFVYVGKMVVDKFWSTLPVSVSWAVFLECVLVALFLKKMARSILIGLTGGPKTDEKMDRRVQFAQSQRQNSVFDVTSNTGRRSSIFESFDESDFTPMSRSIRTITEESSRAVFKEQSRAQAFRITEE